MFMKSLYNHFEILEDPRDMRGKRHELINILIMTIYGILCGYTDFTNLADFLKVHENYFTNLLNLVNGTPSHDTLSKVFAAIDSKNFWFLHKSCGSSVYSYQITLRRNIHHQDIHMFVFLEFLFCY